MALLQELTSITFQMHSDGYNQRSVRSITWQFERSLFPVILRIADNSIGFQLPHPRMGCFTSTWVGFGDIDQLIGRNVRQCCSTPDVGSN